MKKYLVLSFTSILFLLLLISGCGISNNEEIKTENKKNGKEHPSTENRDTSFLFTANEGGSISKISTDEQKVVATLEFDGAVHNVQVSPDGKVVGATVVPNMNHGHDHSSMKMNGKAVFFDSKSNQLIKEVEVGNHPAHIVFTNDGKYALVTNSEDNNVSIIDMSNYSIIKTIQTGKGPHGFRISNDSQFAYIANMDEGTISVLNLQELKEDKKIQVGETPVTTGITSDGKILVVSLNKDNMLAIIDLTTGKIDKVKVGSGPAQVYIQHDNQYAFVANQGTENNPSQSITKVDLNSKQIVATIETGKGSHGVVTSPDNKYTYVTNMFDDSVSVIDNSQNKLVNTIKVGKTPNGISLMP